MGIKEFEHVLVANRDGSFDSVNLAETALSLESNRIETGMSKFEQNFVGTGGFAETGIFRCALLVGFQPGNLWTFRHISPSSMSYIDEAVDGVVRVADERGSDTRYKIVAGSPYLVGRVVGSLCSKGKTINPADIFIEIPYGGDDLDCQEKQVVHFADDTDLLFINLLRDQKVVKI